MLFILHTAPIALGTYFELTLNGRGLCIVADVKKAQHIKCDWRTWGSKGRYI